MLELINRARMDPRGEAKRYGIDLNEGSPSPAISTAPKQVLAGSDVLGKAADKHSKWMAWNGQSHTESGNTPYFYGTNPDDRMERAGYGNLRSWAENIGSRSGSSLDYTQAIYDLHQTFFVDSGVWGRGHRVNIFASDLTEIGIGSSTSAADIFGAKSHHVTVDFADAPGGKRFITGVVYDDKVVKDDFFTVGEQTKGRAVSSGSKQDVTGGGGGYELAFTGGGSKTLTFDLAGADFVVKVQLGSSNVKVDAVNGREIWTNATLESQSSAIKELHALGVGNVKLTGSGGSEKIYGNAGANTLSGKGGNDTIVGGNGLDTLSGGGGDDAFIFRKASNSSAVRPDVI
jgi:Ca2+-binding RTX toxin-like protein